MRRGITLLEVLIATMVLLVGLLGIFSLLPVAKFYMADGSKYDRTSTLGQQAMHYLESRRELLDPTEWHAPAANGNFLQVCPPDGVGMSGTGKAYNYQWPSHSPIATIPAAPFILDPLACAYPDNLQANGGTGANAVSGQVGTTGSFAPTFFPPSGYSLDSPGGIGAIGSPALARVTVPRTGGFTLAGSRPMFTAPMAFLETQKIFTSSDDLVFELPSDPTQRPFLPAPTVNNPSQWSKSAGDYSWFAVIDNMQKPWDPGPDGGWGVASNPPNPATDDDNGDGLMNDIGEAGWNGSDDIALWGQSGGEMWHVSIVTVYKRNLQLVPATATEIPPERMCYCDFLNAPLPVDPTTQQGKAIVDNAGLGGGDCILFVPSTLAPSEEWLNIKPNQWIMLSGWTNLASSLSNPPIRNQLGSIQWFRLTNVGEIEAVTNGSGQVTAWQRKVTLAGQDFNPYKFVDAVGAPGGNQSLYATIIDGVTGVFEGTIEQGE